MSKAISINISEEGRSSAEIAVESAAPEGIPVQAHSVDV